MSKVKCIIWPSQLFILFLFLIFSCKFVFFFFFAFSFFFVFLSFLIILLLHIFLFYFLFFFLFFFSVKDNIPSCDNIPAGSHGTGSCIHNLGLDITVNFISMDIWPLTWKCTLWLSVRALKNHSFAVCHPFVIDGMPFERVGSSVQKKKKNSSRSNGCCNPFEKKFHPLKWPRLPF